MIKLLTVVILVGKYESVNKFIAPVGSELAALTGVIGIIYALFQQGVFVVSTEALERGGTCLMTSYMDDDFLATVDMSMLAAKR